jgi:hypothetical protein
MSSYFLRCCLGFNPITIFRFLGTAGLSACWGECVHMQLVREERNAYRGSLLWFAQYRTRGKSPSFCCMDFFMTFLNFRFMLISIFNSIVPSIPRQSSKMRQARVPCVFSQKQRNNNEIQMLIENAPQGCVLPHVLRYTTPNCSSENQITLKWIGKTHTNVSKYYYCNNWTEYFSVAFSWWNNGGEGGMYFTKEAVWRNRDLSEGSLCVCICFSSPMRKK